MKPHGLVVCLACNGISGTRCDVCRCTRRVSIVYARQRWPEVPDHLLDQLGPNRIS